MSYAITGRQGYSGLGATTPSSPMGTVLVVGLGAILLYALYEYGSDKLRYRKWRKSGAETQIKARNTCYRKSPRLNRAENDVLRDHFMFDASLLYKLSDAEVRDAIRTVPRYRTVAAKGAVSKLRKEMANRAWEAGCLRRQGAAS